MCSLVILALDAAITMFCILDFSVDVILNMAWILGTDISHKKTKEKLKFPQSFPLPFLLLWKFYGYHFQFFCFSCCCFSQSLAFFLEEESGIAQENFFGVFCFSPYK